MILMSGKIGEFFTTRGWYYKGRLVAETSTHYIIFDLKIEKEVELLKSTIEKVEWSEGE